MASDDIPEEDREEEDEEGFDQPFYQAQLQLERGKYKADFRVRLKSGITEEVTGVTLIVSDLEITKPELAVTQTRKNQFASLVEDRCVTIGERHLSARKTTRPADLHQRAAITSGQLKESL